MVDDRTTRFSRIERKNRERRESRFGNRVDIITFEFFLSATLILSSENLILLPSN